MCTQTVLHNAPWSVVQVVWHLFIEYLVHITASEVLLSVSHHLVRDKFINAIAGQVGKASSSRQPQIGIHCH